MPAIARFVVPTLHFSRRLHDQWTRTQLGQNAPRLRSSHRTISLGLEIHTLRELNKHLLLANNETTSLHQIPLDQVLRPANGFACFSIDAFFHVVRFAFKRPPSTPEADAMLLQILAFMVSINRSLYVICLTDKLSSDACFGSIAAAKEYGI